MIRRKGFLTLLKHKCLVFILNILLIIILGEEIDGLAFLKLIALLLHAMGIKMGQAIKIQAIIEEKKVNNLIKYNYNKI